MQKEDPPAFKGTKRPGWTPEGTKGNEREPRETRRNRTVSKKPKQAHNSTKRLSSGHEYQLVVESAISPELLQECEVRTITRGCDLPKGFSPRQRRRVPGILFTIPRPNGDTAYSFRPDAPNPENPGHKYEQPSKRYGGPGNVLGVYTSTRRPISDASVPVMFVEGIKKALAVVSAARAAGVELVVVAISGVWNWLSNGAPIPDMLEIPVEGRPATVCFDSDMLRNPNVMQGADRLAGHLTSRGAEVFIIYFHDQPNGTKTGADDFFAARGTFAELRLLTRPYDPTDFARVRLSRDETLRLAMEDLKRRFWDFEWKGMGGHSARDVALKLIEAARRHGKVVSDGIRVVKAWGPLALEAKISSRTLAKAINRLEEWGFAYRDNEGREADKAGAFVLRASVKYYGEEQSREGKEAQEWAGRDPGTLHLRVPRLRWSDPGRKARVGVVKGTRKVRQTKLKARPPRIRPGKIRGAELDALHNAGGALYVEELCEVLHRPRVRDFRRRNLVKLLEFGLVEWFSEVGTRREVVRLVDNWLQVLEQIRELGGEIEAEATARKRYENKCRAYHSRHKIRADHHPANAGGDAWLEELEKLPPPPDKWSLYALVGKRVNTLSGPGVLWQVFSGEVRVVLDSDPLRWESLDPSELILEAA